MPLPARKEAAAVGLEVDDEVCDLVVSLLLQMCQHTRTEEDLGLSHTVQVGVQFQSMNLQQQKNVKSHCSSF